MTQQPPEQLTELQEIAVAIDRLTSVMDDLHATLAQLAESLDAITGEYNNRSYIRTWDLGRD